MVKNFKRIMLILTGFVMFFNINVYAAGLSCGGISQSAQNFMQAGQTAANNTMSGANGNQGISRIIDSIADLTAMLTVFGIIIVAICMVILGIQWVYSKPSPDAQAKLKSRFFGLAIAAGVLAAAFPIFKLVVTILDGIF